MMIRKAFGDDPFKPSQSFLRYDSLHIIRSAPCRSEDVERFRQLHCDASGKTDGLLAGKGYGRLEMAMDGRPFAQLLN